jgi:hypothetical protein
MSCSALSTVDPDVDMLLPSAGKCLAPVVGWERLCADVRPLVLRNLSLHDLARTALTCREFGQEFSRRLAEERAVLILVGEATFGKQMFTGFVSAFQHLMCNMDAFPGLLPQYQTCLSIDTDGSPEYPEDADMLQRSAAGIPRVHICKGRGRDKLYGQLQRGLPGEPEELLVCIFVGENESPEGAHRLWLQGSYWPRARDVRREPWLWENACLTTPPFMLRERERR